MRSGRDEVRINSLLAATDDWNLTVRVVWRPEATLAGLKVVLVAAIWFTLAVNCAQTVVPVMARIVADVSLGTLLVSASNSALVWPDRNWMVAGTRAAAGLVEARRNVKPFGGAGRLIVSRPRRFAMPPVTAAGVTASVVRTPRMSMRVDRDGEPARVAVIVANVSASRKFVVKENGALSVAPSGMEIEVCDRVLAAGFEFINETEAPPRGAGPVSRTRRFTTAPAVTSLALETKEAITTGANGLRAIPETKLPPMASHWPSGLKASA